MVNLGSIALALPGVDEGIACAGTSLESQTYRVNEKNFLFVAGKEARLKLSISAVEARRRGCAVGANGWVKLSLDALPPASVVRRWIAESHSLAAAGSAEPRARARTRTTKRPTR
jgi:hypothetical protein